MGETDSRNKWIPKYQFIMRALNKHSKNNEVIFPETLGEKLFAFGRDKFKTLTKNINQVAANDFLKIKVHSISKMDQFSKSATDDRRNKIIPLNFSDFLTSDFEQDRNYKEKTQLEQATILPLKIQELFSKWLKLRLPSIRIHQSNLSDKFLKARHADAMTIDRDIYFRKGQFDIKSARGLGLLGHELTHIAQQQSDDWRNSSSKYNAEQVESTALDNERFIVQRSKRQNQFTNLSPPLTKVPPSDSLSASQPGNVSSTPMFADTSRNAGELQNSSSKALNMSVLSEIEMRRIKDEVYRDLMMRIKIEFERGS